KLLATQGLPASVAVALVARSAVAAGGWLSAYVVLRLTLAWGAAVGLNDDIVRRRGGRVPLWGRVAFWVALAALVTNRIAWRGQVYELRRGKLVVLRRS